ncbi:MAG: DinB family protein, partial [Gemmataceae bacterium]
ARPVPGKWSIAEVVGHLADFEIVFTDRIQRLIALPKPLLLAADEQLYLQVFDYNTRDVSADMTMIVASRARLRPILEKFLPTHGTAPGIHTEKGLVTLTDVVTYTTSHVLHHTKFVDEKITALRTV